MSMIRTELKQSGEIKLGSATVRKLAGIPSGAIPMGMLRGKSSTVWLNINVQKYHAFFITSYKATVLAPKNNQYGESVDSVIVHPAMKYGGGISQFDLSINSSYRGVVTCTFKDGNSEISMDVGWSNEGGYTTANAQGYRVWTWLKQREKRTVKFKMERK